MFRGAKYPLIRRVVAFASAFAAGMSILSSASAMRVAPMVSELTSAGAGSTARVEVGNIGAAALPFETRITRITFDDKGALVEEPADEEFLVFPPQGVVPVGGRQVVRVQWVGEPRLVDSHAYYLWVKQLPVATEPVQSESGGAVSVSVLYTMKALIVVAPDGAEPDVQVVSAVPAMVTPPAPELDASLTKGQAAPPPPPAQPGVEITVSNSGHRYALMSGATWVIEGTKAAGGPFSMTLTGQQVSETVGIGYLAPSGGRRTFKVPTGEALDPKKPVTVRFAR
ncbi:MAG: molecular chaperone [Pseudomonadota bacterium]